MISETDAIDSLLPHYDLRDFTVLSFVQLSVRYLQRSQYPSGFYVVLVVHATDEACASEAPSELEAEQLWEDSLAGNLYYHPISPAATALERRKDFLITVQVFFLCH